VFRLSKRIECSRELDTNCASTSGLTSRYQPPYNEGLPNRTDSREAIWAARLLHTRRGRAYCCVSSRSSAAERWKAAGIPHGRLWGKVGYRKVDLARLVVRNQKLQWPQSTRARQRARVSQMVRRSRPARKSLGPVSPHRRRDQEARERTRTRTGLENLQASELFGVSQFGTSNGTRFQYPDSHERVRFIVEHRLIRLNIVQLASLTRPKHEQWVAARRGGGAQRLRRC